MTKYKIADLTVAVEAEDQRFWSGIEWHYAPFAIDGADADLRVVLTQGDVDGADGYQLVFSDDNADPGAVRTDFWRDEHGNMRFDIQSPLSDGINGRLYIDKDLRTATFTMLQAKSCWTGQSVTTCALQLAYMLAGAHRHTLMSHSSCVVVDGRAYLFIGKSGTGKSTHSRLWLDNIPGSMLLNDDHPIVVAGPQGATAYGSPWSGKTDCYVNAQAPIAAIVRIKQAPHNRIRRQSPIEAYASLIASFSGLTFMPQFADLRHADIERLVLTVPCYELECLPDADAAILCHERIDR